MSSKKDKEKVIDPVWGEERIREFLELLPPTGENPDHHKLLKAYQSMRAEDFDDFIQYFTEAGGDLTAKDNLGKTVSDTISLHRYGQPYIDSINKRI